jgi:putative restriction endonuclease
MDKTQEAILERIRSLNTWKRGGERAPHKPLLLLLSLSRITHGLPRLVAFSDLEFPLAKLLRNYGPPRASVHPEYPFWHLQSDGLWEVVDGDSLRKRRGGSDPLKSELISQHVQGGLPETIYLALRDHPVFLNEVARVLLDRNFPSSLHEDILNELGLSISLVGRRKRDGQFRANVVTAYGHCCAICGFDLKIGVSDFALDAAHIKWHQVGGPDVVDNGLALCSIHHKGLDRGVIGFSEDQTILISVELHGSSWAKDWFEEFKGKPLRKPTRGEWHPKDEYLSWHFDQVFRPPARD